MDQQQETWNTWNKVATLYQEKFMQLDLYNHTYDQLCNQLNKQGARILEIGCGPGNIARYLLNKRPDFRLFGIDMAPNMIALAEKNNPTARFAVMDCRHIGALKEKYDGIVAGFCIPYLSSEETNQLFEATNTLLEDEGLLYLSFVEGSPLQSGFKTSSTGDRTYFYYHELNTITMQLARHQFTDFAVYKVLYPKDTAVQEEHTIILGRKKNGI